MDRAAECQRSSPGLQTELAGGVLLTKKVVIDSDSAASATMTDYRRLRNATFNKTLRSSKQDTLERKMDEALESGELYLDGMRISSFPARLLVDCTHITKLYLHNNSLIVLPPDIQKLTALEDLSLESNQLVSLPKELGKLLHLKRLHCYDNQISSLPAELGLLVELTRLFLSKNQIGSLPPEIGFLKNLQWLSLEDNRLEYLPPEIGNLKKLGWLSVEGNQCAPLPRIPLPLARSALDSSQPCALLSFVVTLSRSLSRSSYLSFSLSPRYSVLSASLSLSLLSLGSLVALPSPPRHTLSHTLTPSRTRTHAPAHSFCRCSGVPILTDTQNQSATEGNG